jgi:hypothetical protein
MSKLLSVSTYMRNGALFLFSYPSNHIITITFCDMAFFSFKSKMLQMAAQLGASEILLPEGIGLLQGTLRDAPVSMESLAWHTEKYRLIRYTGLVCEGRIATFNLVLYPHACFDAPIFASDWVVLGDRLRIGVIDAMPLFAEEEQYAAEWIAPFMPLQEESLALAPVYERKLSWSTRYLGPAACLATDVEVAALPALEGLWEKYLMRYLELTKKMTPVPAVRRAQVLRWHQDYNEAHLAVEDKRNPYMVYFGREAGERYNREFLFSESLGGHEPTAFSSSVQ